MAVVVTYDFINIKSEFILNYSANIATAADLCCPDILALADGGFAVSYEWSLAPDHQILQERYTIDGLIRQPVGFLDLAPFAAVKEDVSVTQLTGGGILTTWTHQGSGIHYAITDPVTGNLTRNDTLLPSTDGNDINSDVVALQNGGFVIVKQDNLAANDQDADFLFYNAAGVFQTGDALGNNSGSDEQAPAVTVLNNGNVAIAYEKEQVDNTDTFGMAIEIYTEAGVVVLDETVFDNNGNGNRRPDILALNDGGFAVAYEDNEYGEQGVTVAFFNAGGTLLGTARADGGFFSDDDVKLSKLANGFVVASWTDNGVDIVAAVFDPVTRTRLGGPFIVEDQNGQQEQSSVAGLANGTFVTAWLDYNTAIADGNNDPSGAHVSMQIDALRRTSTGDGAANTITGDALIDVINGGGGIDILNGKAGNDTLNGGAARDTMRGGDGSDSYVADLFNDVVVETNADLATGGNDRVVFNGVAGTFALGLNVERLTLGGAAAISGKGNGLANTLIGNGAANTLTGGLGADKLTGGAGLDLFDFNAITESTGAAAGRDTITDFNETATDRIDLSTIDANSVLAGNNVFTFIGAGPFTGLGQVRAFASGANTIVDINTTGTNAPDMRILLPGLHVLDAADFVL